jgi:hypothetical protein
LTNAPSWHFDILLNVNGAVDAAPDNTLKLHKMGLSYENINLYYFFYYCVTGFFGRRAPAERA